MGPHCLFCPRGCKSFIWLKKTPLFTSSYYSPLHKSARGVKRTKSYFSKSEMIPQRLVTWTHYEWPLDFCSPLAHASLRKNTLWLMIWLFLSSCTSLLIYNSFSWFTATMVVTEHTTMRDSSACGRDLAMKGCAHSQRVWLLRHIFLLFSFTSGKSCLGGK
jgi:hypothetical protein